MEKNNIILIGFMGVGKGTTARAYSKEYGVFNIDTDDLIESKENMKIKNIFKEYGEEYFRSLEQECANWIETSVDNSFISCGGGFYKVNNIKRLGKVVLLDASYDWIYNRLLSAKNSKAKLKKRPLFSEPQKAKQLYKERKEVYKKIADIIIDVESKDLTEIIKEIHKKAYL
jgi:shikimate kinase